MMIEGSGPARPMATGGPLHDESSPAVGASTAQYRFSPAAERAASEFRRRAAGEDPDEIPEVTIPADKLDTEGRIPAFVLVKELGFEPSSSNARRVIAQGGFTIGPDRETIADPKALIAVSDGLIVRVGKRKIVRVRLPARGTNV